MNNTTGRTSGEEAARRQSQSGYGPPDARHSAAGRRPGQAPEQRQVYRKQQPAETRREAPRRQDPGKRERAAAPAARPRQAGHRQAAADAPRGGVYRAGDNLQAAERRREQLLAARAAANKKRRRRKKAVLISGSVFLSLVLVLCIGLYVLYTIIRGNISGEETHAGVLPAAVQTLPQYTGDGVNFLVCGIDYDEVDSFSGPDHIGNTDMILYCHYDTRANKLSILQIPRDSFVGSKVNTGGTGRINGLYRHADDTDNRMAALAQVLYDQFRLTTDFYITIDMDAVKEIIGIKGGIEVYVSREVVDPENASNSIPVGWRHFTPDEAEFYLRNRNYSGSDVQRLQMQQYFYSALFREFKQLTPNDLVMWMKVLMYRVKTDMVDLDELWQLGGIAQTALSLEGEDITFVRPAVSGADYNGQKIVSLVPKDLAEVLNTWFRFDGEKKYTAAELDVYTLPVNEYGTVERNVRTMGDVQASEGQH